LKTAVLAFETSCDETSCAVVCDGREVLSNIVYSQIALHQKFGGVVPEVASRNHVLQLSAVIDAALNGASFSFSDISAVAVTYAPGLVGALLTGVSYAKALAYSLGIPFASTLVFTATMVHQDAPGTTFKRHMKIARGLLDEDDYLLSEILFNPRTPRQISRIQKELSDLQDIIKNKDTDAMKVYLDKLRKKIE
jgi:tRNA A37 threonylcarbamoyladenosine modification protein TsaB